jgi:hypothetical protein
MNFSREEEEEEEQHTHSVQGSKNALNEGLSVPNQNYGYAFRTTIGRQVNQRLLC